MSDPKQPDVQADDLDLDVDVVGDLEPETDTTDEVRGGDRGCTRRSEDF